MTARLFVGNLNPRTTETDLRSFFSSAGSLTSLIVPMDRKTGRPRGFAFAEFSSEEEAQRALATLAGRSLDGRQIHLSWAREKRPAEPRNRSRAPSGTNWRGISVAETEDDLYQSALPTPWSSEDYARKRRSKPLRRGKHGSDRLRSRGVKRSIR